MSNYERGILASGGALWLLWLAIALRLPKESKQRDDSRPNRHQQSPGPAGRPRGHGQNRRRRHPVESAAKP